MSANSEGRARVSSWSPRGMRAAFLFLTRIPVGGGPYTEPEWQRATGHFPLVGAVLGGLLAGVALLLQPHAGAPATALIVLAVAMLLTGAFHEDGLADTADALGGAFDREKLFVILKDSRVGTYGAAALVVSLGLRAALLARLDGAMPLALVLSQCVARLPPIALMRYLPYVTSVSDAGEAKSRLVARASGAELRTATLWVTALVGVVWLQGALSLGQVLAMAAVLTLASLGLAQRFRARAGGVTGDFLGATEQVAECLVLMVLAWR
jgi:adenosylcobinamide-GDP ribazoletransferase